MLSMKFGIIKERKNPPDRRVVLSPSALVELKKHYPQAEIVVESSDIRVFANSEYEKVGFKIVTSVEDCDVLIGVKEVPVENLIPNKTYIFFSHTIKKQQHNQKLLQACLQKNITLIDHETLVDAKNKRLIGFGRYAGIVGAYNGIRAFGMKYELFNLVKAETLPDQNALIERLKRQTLPNIKIVLTGFGKVGMGAKEMLDAMKIKEISVDDFLNKNYSQPVYTHIDIDDYNKRLDRKPFDKLDFYTNPSLHTSDFERFTKVADIFMTGHFYGNGAPEILTLKMLQSPNNNIRVVADISCDVEGPIACTIRSSTIANPIYGFYPFKNEEVDYMHPAAIVVMAVDNLPCELPKDASEGFGETFIKHIIPAFFNNDLDQILERATICKKGELTEKFSYLEEYAFAK